MNPNLMNRLSNQGGYMNPSFPNDRHGSQAGYINPGLPNSGLNNQAGFMNPGLPNIGPGNQAENMGSGSQNNRSGDQDRPMEVAESGKVEQAMPEKNVDRRDSVGGSDLEERAKLKEDTEAMSERNVESVGISEAEVTKLKEQNVVEEAISPKKIDSADGVDAGEGAKVKEPVNILPTTSTGESHNEGNETDDIDKNKVEDDDEDVTQRNVESAGCLPTLERIEIKKEPNDVELKEEPRDVKQEISEADFRDQPTDAELKKEPSDVESQDESEREPCEERAFECDTCALLFKSQEAMERHKKMEHNKKSEIEQLAERIRKRAVEISQSRSAEQPASSVETIRSHLERDVVAKPLSKEEKEPEPGTSSGSKGHKKHECTLCGQVCPNIEGLIDHLKLHEEAENKMRQLAASNYFSWLQTMAFMNSRFTDMNYVMGGSNSNPGTAGGKKNLIPGLPDFSPGMNNGPPGMNNPIASMNNLLVDMSKGAPGMPGGMPADMSMALGSMMAMAKNGMGLPPPGFPPGFPPGLPGKDANKPNASKMTGIFDIPPKRPAAPAEEPPKKVPKKEEDIVGDSVECDICMLLLPTPEAVKNHKQTVHKSVIPKVTDGKIPLPPEGHKTHSDGTPLPPEGFLPGRITGPRTTDRNNPWENDAVKLNGELYVYTEMKSLDDHSPEEIEKEIQKIISLPPPPRNIHSIGKTFQCFVCEMMFYSHETLTTHLKVHLKPFQCPQCKKRFLFQGHLNSHMRTHSTENSFECESCNIRFARRDSYIKHMASHGDTKSFHCNYCGKDFRQKSVFDIHLRIHTGEKPYECSICNMRFSHATTYRRHTMIHTGEKPFECKTCNKKFARKCNLAAHIAIHTGDKPFECDQCSMRFAQRSHLTKHHRVHELDRMKPFFCHICKKGYTRRDYFNKHNRIYHTGDNEKPWGNRGKDGEFPDDEGKSEGGEGEEGPSEGRARSEEENEPRDFQEIIPYEDEEEEEEEGMPGEEGRSVTAGMVGEVGGGGVTGMAGEAGQGVATGMAGEQGGTGMAGQEGGYVTAGIPEDDMGILASEAILNATI